MDQREDLPAPKRDLTPLQEAVWLSASATTIILSLLFFRRFYDGNTMGDPVIVGILVAYLLFVCWALKRWIKSSITDERLNRLIDFIRR